MSILNRTKNPRYHERLTRFKRWPSLQAAWDGSKVVIWSGEHGAYWKPEGKGYTERIQEAGVWDFIDALRMTFHCCKNKQIEYKRCNVTVTPTLLTKKHATC